jgi:NADPH:quinone reductase-like Zn-dependent oxidoreductase
MKSKKRKCCNNRKNRRTGEMVMKAILQNGYGSSEVLSIGEVNKPTIKENEILIRVHAASLNAGDVFSMRGTPYMIRFAVGFPKPKNYILGWDVAGKVEKVGKEVSNFKLGDKVYTSCESALAEYVSVEVGKVAMRPKNLTFAEAAAVPTAALTALQGIRDAGKVKKSQKVLINGASGGVGHFAVQIAKIFGAEVTGVCSTQKVDMVRSIGADHVIDYKKEDFTKDNERYDFIFDMVANHKFKELRHALKKEGLIQPNSGHGGVSYVLKAFALSPFNRQIGKMYLTKVTTKDLNVLKDMIEAGNVKPVMDKIYPFEDTPDAMAYLDRGDAKGKVVVKFVD